MDHFLAYAEFASFEQRMKPFTPYGRDYWQELGLITSQAKLEELYDRTAEALNFIQEIGLKSTLFSRITYHLQRLPRFPQAVQDLYDEVELFELKKFLYNYRLLLELLPSKLKEFFHLEFHSEELYSLLDLGPQSREAFFVVDEYSTELAQLRKAIRLNDVRMTELKQATDARLQSLYDLSFGELQFLVVPKSVLGDPEKAREDLSLEPFDSSSYLVRPKMSGEMLTLAEQRRQWEVQERAAENEILRDLAQSVSRELDSLLSYRKQVTELDLALSRAHLALNYNLVRPLLMAPAALDGNIQIEDGRFIPCEEACQERGTDYQPLKARLSSHTTVLFGSNMGGKTITLKTLAFLQLCAQKGLYVPAKQFRTRVYSHLHYIGEVNGAGSMRQGLSGFGFEIAQFRQAFDDFREPTLALFDEFARTTNSGEAQALISAILRQFSNRPQVTAIFSTHFRGILRLPEVCYLRMKGLNHQRLRLSEASSQAGQSDLLERLKLIDSFMDYVLVPDDGLSSVSDAIEIARLLGVDDTITSFAHELYQG